MKIAGPKRNGYRFGPAIFVYSSMVLCGDRIALPIFQQKAKKAIRKSAIHCGTRLCGCIFFASNRQNPV